jgi:hypothetical protein
MMQLSRNDRKEPNHEGHEVHQEETQLIYGRFSFVTLVSFVVKNGGTDDA